MTEYMIWERKKPLKLMGSTQNGDLEPRYVKVRYGVEEAYHDKLMEWFRNKDKSPGEWDIPIYCYRNFAADPPEHSLPEDAPREKRVTVWTTGPPMPAKEFLRLYEPTGEVLS